MTEAHFTFFSSQYLLSRRYDLHSCDLHRFRDYNFSQISFNPNGGSSTCEKISGVWGGEDIFSYESFNSEFFRQKAPWRFSYNGCSELVGSRLRSKTVGTCEHNGGQSKSIYRFDVYLFDQSVGAGIDCPPLCAVVFQAAETLLDMEVEYFLTLCEDDQLQMVQARSGQMVEADVILKTRKDRSLILQSVLKMKFPQIDLVTRDHHSAMRRKKSLSPPSKTFGTPASSYGTPGSSFTTPIVIGHASPRSASTKLASDEDIDSIKNLLQIAMDKLDLKSQ